MRIYEEGGRRLIKMTLHPGYDDRTVHVVDMDAGMWAGRPSGHVTLCGEWIAGVPVDRGGRRVDCGGCRAAVRELRGQTPGAPTPRDDRDLRAVGDLLQSSASRLAEWVRRQPGAPYEVRAAALEAASAVDRWTVIRVNGDKRACE